MTSTREAWLGRAIEMFRPMFVAADAPLPRKVHVSVGFAHGAKKENATILGQTWATRASEDGINHVFISPEIGDSFDVLETLLHELVHVADDCRDGHRGRFAIVAKKLGLMAPMTVTPASPSLQAELVVISAELGVYPHGALHPHGMPAREPVFSDGTTAPSLPSRAHSGPGTQRTRLLKVLCPHCGYTVRVTRRWLDVGMPRCPDGHAMEEQ